MTEIGPSVQKLAFLGKWSSSGHRVVTDRPDGLGWPRMISVGLGWSQVVLDGLSESVSVDLDYHRMV